MDSVVSKELDLLDPNPDIHDLFKQLDTKYFDGKLSKGGINVEWNDTMTLDAGDFLYKQKLIRLSSKLLQFRTRSDVVDILMHEMIHAYLFVSNSTPRFNDHKEPFINFMNSLNSKAGTHISVFHNFREEVDFLNPYQWKCKSCGFIFRKNVDKPPKTACKNCGGNFEVWKTPTQSANPTANNSKNRTYQIGLDDILKNTPKKRKEPEIIVLDDSQEEITLLNPHKKIPHQQRDK